MIESLILAIDARQMRRGAQEAIDAANAIGRAVNVTGRQVTHFSTTIDRAGQAGVNFRGIFAGGLGLIGLSLGLSQTIGTLSNFGREMSTLAAVTRASEAELASFNNTAQRLGANTEFTGAEAASGLTFLARAGLKTNEILDAIEPSLNLALVGGLGLGEAADIASNALTQFNLTADKTVDVVDTLTIVSNNSNTNVQQLAEALKFAGAIAGPLGQSFEEVASAIGVLGNAGIQASLAGTGLRGIFSTLLSPSRGARDALSDLGLTVKELNPASVSLTDIFRKLGETTLGAGQAVQIFSRRNAGAALILSRNAGEIKRLAELTQTLEDASAIAAKTIGSDLQGSIKTLQSAIQGAILSVGEAGLTGALKSAFEVITGTVRILFDMEGALNVTDVRSRALAASIGTLAKVFGVVIAINLAGKFVGLTQAILGSITAVNGLTVALLANPIGLIVVAIGALVAAFFLLSDETVTFGKTTATVGETVEGIWLTLTSSISTAWEKTIKFINSAWDTVTAVASGVVNVVSNLWAELSNKIRTVWENETVQFLVAQLKSAANEIINIWIGVGAVFNNIFEQVQRNVQFFKDVATLSNPFLDQKDKLPAASRIAAGASKPDFSAEEALVAFQLQQGQQRLQPLLDQAGELLQATEIALSTGLTTLGTKIGKAANDALEAVELNIGNVQAKAAGSRLQLEIDALEKARTDKVAQALEERTKLESDLRAEYLKIEAELDRLTESAQNTGLAIEGVADALAEAQASINRARADREGPRSDLSLNIQSLIQSAPTAAETVTGSLAGLQDSLSGAAADFSQDLLATGVTFTSAFQQLVISIEQAAIEAFITGPIQDSIKRLVSSLFQSLLQSIVSPGSLSTGLPSINIAALGRQQAAFGAVFGPQGRVRNAFGGILTGTQTFAASNGINSVAEAGFEAVMPVTITPRGLGVNATGLGGNVTNVNTTVVTQDIGGFREATSHISARARREFSR